MEQPKVLYEYNKSICLSNHTLLHSVFAGPGDYTPIERSLTFTSSVQDISVSVPLTDDELFEESEHFFASLVLEPTGLNVQLDLTQAHLTILDVDGIG